MKRETGIGGLGRDDGGSAYLLHNTSLALGKGNVTTRLILDELDLDLTTLPSRLVVIIIVVFGTHAVALGPTGIGAVARLLQVIVLVGREFLVDGGHVGHDG